MAERAVVVRLIANVQDYRRGMQQAAADTKGISAATDKAGRDVTGLGATAATQGGRIKRSLDGVKTSADKMGIGAKVGAGVAGAAMVTMARDSVRAASSLNEQMAATETIFGDAADAMVDFADSASALGIAKTEALQAGNAFGDLFSKLGYTSQASQVFSEDLVRMSADFASFRDMNPGEVLDKLRSGLAGESEPLRQLGVFLTEAKVKAEAMTLGLVDAHGEIDEGAKVAARYSLIMKQMGDAQGDVARTADSYANTQRRAAAETENLKASIGQQLLPVMTDGAYILAELTKALGGVADGAKDGAEGLDILERKLGRTEEHAVYGKSGLELLAGVIRKLKGDSEEAADATDYLADSQEALADTESRVAKNVEATTKQLEEQAQALDDLLQATISQFDAEIAYERSLLSLSDALAEYDAALAANAAGKGTNEDAAAELAAQELDLRDALLEAGNAAVRQAEENAAAAGKTLSESEKYDIFRDALIRLKEQFPQLGAQIDAYVARLDAVPKTVTTNVQVVGVAKAEADMMRVEKAIRGVTSIGGVTVTIPPITARGPQGDGPGRGGPALQRIRASLPDGLRVTSTYRSPAHNARVGGSPTSFHMDRNNPAVDIAGPTGLLDSYHRKLKSMGGWRELIWRAPGHYDHIHAAAQGGYISGPGTGTSDSIPALLSNGEYVVRAAAVAKVGRQTLDRINRYATGGLVGGRQHERRGAGPVPAGMVRAEDGSLVPSSFYAAPASPDRSGRPAGDPNYGADRGWGPNLLPQIAGLTDVDEINAATVAWERYNEEVEYNARLQELLADEAEARAAIASAKTVEEEADAHRDLNTAMQATTDLVLGRRREDEARAVEQIVASLEKQAEAERELAEAQRQRQDNLHELGVIGAVEYLAILEQRMAAEEMYSDAWMALYRQRESVLKAEDDKRRERTQKLKDELEKRQGIERDAFDRLNSLLDQEADVQARQVQAEANYYTRRSALGRQFNDEQARILDARRTTLASWARLDQVSSPAWGNTVEQLVDNAHDQLDQFREWMDALATARSRGVSESVITALGLDEGPQALGQLRQFNEATIGEITALNSAVEQRTALAGQQVAREQMSTYTALGQELAQAQRTYMAEIQALEAEFLAEQEALAAEMAAIGQDQGRSYGQALEQGLRSTIPGILAAAKEAADAARGVASASPKAPVGSAERRAIVSAFAEKLRNGTYGDPNGGTVVSAGSSTVENHVYVVVDGEVVQRSVSTVLGRQQTRRQIGGFR